ncbi:MAG: hypothetical protein ACRC46_09925 [Thermoguttaceae bacterium]
MKKMLFVLCCFASLVLGCNSGKVPMHGTVVFSDNNEPLSVGTVCFDNGKIQARGGIKPDGTYVLGTDDEKDGLPLGTYRVCVMGALQPSQQGAMGGHKSTINSKFADLSTSGITVEVDGKSNTFDFKVDRP